MRTSILRSRFVYASAVLGSAAVFLGVTAPGCGTEAESSPFAIDNPNSANAPAIVVPDEPAVMMLARKFL